MFFSLSSCFSPAPIGPNNSSSYQPNFFFVTVCPFFLHLCDAWCPSPQDDFFLLEFDVLVLPVLFSFYCAGYFLSTSFPPRLSPGRIRNTPFFPLFENCIRVPEKFLFPDCIPSSQHFSPSFFHRSVFRKIFTHLGCFPLTPPALLFGTCLPFFRGIWYFNFAVLLVPSCTTWR